MNIFKRLYDWMLSWGNSRWGAVALFCFAFAESSFFPIPPDVLLIALCLGAATRAFRFAAICTVGSILGALAGYAIGYYAWQNGAGEYTALIVRLGRGEGDNWWCVVYPPLCFAATNSDVVYKSKIKEIIENFYR